MATAGLYAGVGGLELGFSRYGFDPVLLSEIDLRCQEVLKARFPATVVGDVAQVATLPRVEILLAGFPCQPYSQVGPTRGLVAGEKHIYELFRLIDSPRIRPKHVVLENVPFIAHLDGGSALRHILAEFEARKYRWAYRIVDASSFGLPQRRRRWVFIASRASNPAAMLLTQDETSAVSRKITANGFYWTEGNRGIGWAENAIPPLKGGSSWGIASPPAIWSRLSNRIVTPTIRGAERLQGFSGGWTEVESTLSGRGMRQRWRMIGNAVSVSVAEWLASRFWIDADEMPEATPLEPDAALPKAAFFDGTRRYRAVAGNYPIATPTFPLMSYLKGQVEPLSLRATRGFRQRYERSSLRKQRGFIEALRLHERTYSQW